VNKYHNPSDEGVVLVNSFILLIFLRFFLSLFLFRIFFLSYLHPSLIYTDTTFSCSELPERSWVQTLIQPNHHPFLKNQMSINPNDIPAHLRGVLSSPHLPPLDTHIKTLPHRSPNLSPRFSPKIDQNFAQKNELKNAANNYQSSTISHSSYSLKSPSLIQTNQNDHAHGYQSSGRHLGAKKGILMPQKIISIKTKIFRIKFQSVGLDRLKI